MQATSIKENTPAAGMPPASHESIQNAGPKGGLHLPFSYMRVVACIGIVLLHTLFAEVGTVANLSKSEVLFSNIGIHMLMWAVPLFLMVTGALLLDPKREVPTEKVLRKYLPRMVIALVIFVALWSVMDVAAPTGKQPVAWNLLAILKDAGMDLVTGNSQSYLWYLYLMIGIYLMIPFYRAVTKHCSDRELRLLAVVLALFVSILPLVQLGGWKMGFYIPTTIIFPLYVLLGYLIHNEIVKIGFASGAALVVLSSAALIFLTVVRLSDPGQWLPENQGNAFDELLFNYPSILVVLQSMGVFALMNKIKVNPSAPHSLLRSVDKCTFGIYLIHMFFLRVSLVIIGFDPYEVLDWLCFAVMTVIFFSLSYVITLILRKLFPHGIL